MLKKSWKAIQNNSTRLVNQLKVKEAVVIDPEAPPGQKNWKIVSRKESIKCEKEGLIVYTGTRGETFLKAQQEYTNVRSENN